MSDEELRALAEAATRGPWREGPGAVWTDWRLPNEALGQPFSLPEQHIATVSGPNRAYIVAVSPDVVLDLLDRLELAEQRARVTEMAAAFAAVREAKDDEWTVRQHREDAKIVQTAMQRLAEARTTYPPHSVYVPLDDASSLLMALQRVGLYKPSPVLTLLEDAMVEEHGTRDAILSGTKVRVVEP